MATVEGVRVHVAGALPAERPVVEHVAALIGLREATPEGGAEHQENRQTPECARAAARMRAGSTHATVSTPLLAQAGVTYRAP